MAVARQHREPVTLPPPRLPGQRVEPDGPADDPVGEADDVDRGRVVIVAVPVLAAGPAGVPEEALLDDEDLVTDPEVRRPLRGRGHRTAGKPGLGRWPASGC
jgi:hypothetical protein